MKVFGVRFSNGAQSSDLRWEGIDRIFSTYGKAKAYIEKSGFKDTGCGVWYKDVPEDSPLLPSMRIDIFTLDNMNGLE